MNDLELKRTVAEYEQKFRLPVTDVLKMGPDKVVDCLIDFFPSLQCKQKSGIIG